MKTEPTTFIQAIKHFADPALTREMIVGLRWLTGVHCPTCGRADIRFISTRRMQECKEKYPKRQFSSKIGTIFEDSPLGLDKWFSAIWMIANCKNGINSHEMHRALGVTQKSAWFMLHRIRFAMQAGSIMKMDTEVEADESFLGGLSESMHKAKRKTAIKGTGGASNTAVMGILQRNTGKNPSRVRAEAKPH